MAGLGYVDLFLTDICCAYNELFWQCAQGCDVVRKLQAQPSIESSDKRRARFYRIYVEIFLVLVISAQRFVVEKPMVPHSDDRLGFFILKYL